MAHLIIEQPGVPAITILLEEEVVVLGRAEDATVPLVADEVSRNHARIMPHNGRFVIEDSKSLNGTYVNRQRVVQRVLSHLDEVWLGGQCRIVYRDDDPPGMKRPSITPAPSDSALLADIARISSEMESLGSSLSMIASRKEAPRLDETAQPPTPAMAMGSDMRKMGQAFRRLEALYRATKLIASEFDLQRRLESVVDAAIEVMEAERGFVMLYNDDTGALEVRVARGMGHETEGSTPSMSIANQAATTGEPVLVKSALDDSQWGAQHSIIQQQIRSAICVPLAIEKRVLGSIYVDMRNPKQHFSEEDVELFASMAAQLAMAIENVRLHDRMIAEAKHRANLGRFLSPAVVEQVLQHGTQLGLGGQKRFATTMFCDIRGFTSLAERLAPTELVGALNEHFTAMTEIIFRHQGTLDKFIGDEIMAVFGSPITRDDDTARAVQAGLEMLQRNAELNEQRGHRGLPPLQIGIGMATGEVIAGYVGSPDRMEFTVVGDHVNVASRLCSKAQAGQLLALETTYADVQNFVVAESVGLLELKGKESRVEAYHIQQMITRRGPVGTPRPTG